MNVKLLVMQGRPAGKTLIFGPGDYYLGRGEECHVRFNSDWVSRQHCLLNVKKDHAVLTDLASRNGTLINGQLVQAEYMLRPGDQLQIGPVVFEVMIDLPQLAETTPPEMIGTVDQESGREIVAMDSTDLRPALQQETPAEGGANP